MMISWIFRQFGYYKIHPHILYALSRPEVQRIIFNKIRDLIGNDLSAMIDKELTEGIE